MSQQTKLEPLKQDDLRYAVEFTVPRVFPTINTLSRKHWGYRHNQIALTQTEFTAILGRNKMKYLRFWAECNRRVEIRITVYHRKAFDPDNLISCAKIPLDSLKGLRCIVDDSDKWITLHVRQEISKDVRTVFRIRPERDRVER